MHIVTFDSKRNREETWVGTKNTESRKPEMRTFRERINGGGIKGGGSSEKASWGIKNQQVKFMCVGLMKKRRQHGTCVRG
jgi:hypothetical protein